MTYCKTPHIRPWRKLCTYFETQRRLMRSLVTAFSARNSPLNAAGEIELQSRQMTPQRLMWLLLSQHELNRCVCFIRVFLTSKGVVLFEQFYCSSDYLTFCVFQPRPGPVGVGYEGFFCSSSLGLLGLLGIIISVGLGGQL